MLSEEHAVLIYDYHKRVDRAAEDPCWWMDKGKFGFIGR